MNKIIETTQGLILSTNLKKSESNWREDDCFKLIYSMEGKMRYESARNTFSIHEEAFLLFNPQDRHRQLEVDHHKFLIELKPAYLNEVASTLSDHNNQIHFAQIHQKNFFISQWVQFVHPLIQLDEMQQDSSLETFLDHSFAQLAILLSKQAISTFLSDVSIKQLQTLQPAFYVAVCKIKNDYQHNWSLEEMAKLLDISKFQFAHTFKELFGISPYSWLQCFRILQSQQLLANTNQPIISISNDCGFSSVSVFNQLFKKLYGMTPSFFRSYYQKQI